MITGMGSSQELKWEVSQQLQREGVFFKGTLTGSLTRTLTRSLMGTWIGRSTRTLMGKGGIWRREMKPKNGKRKRGWG